MDRVRTVATFVAGVLVGGSAVYFSPPAASGNGGMAGGSPSAATGGPLLPPLPDGQAGMTPQGMGQPGVGQPGVGQPGMDQPGTQPTGDIPPGGGAMGAPPAELTTAPAGAVQTSGSRLEKHLRVASSIWSEQAELAKASSDEGVRGLAADLGVHAQSVPEITEHMPPMQEVAGYLASSRVLLDRMQAAGMDVAELSLQVDMLMRPPRGKIPGGTKAGGAPQ